MRWSLLRLESSHSLSNPWAGGPSPLHWSLPALRGGWTVHRPTFGGHTGVHRFRLDFAPPCPPVTEHYFMTTDGAINNIFCLVVG